MSIASHPSLMFPIVRFSDSLGRDRQIQHTERDAQALRSSSARKRTARQASRCTRRQGRFHSAQAGADASKRQRSARQIVTVESVCADV